MSKDITADSTKEEVADYYVREFQIPEESKNIMIKEDISGDILPDVTESDYNLFGIKKGSRLK